MNPQPNTGGSRALPRRSPFTIIIPIAVVACMIVIVAWSAWPLLRPARIIEIEQAIIAPTSDTTEPEPSTSTAEPARSTRLVQAAGWLEAEPYFVAATALADGVIGEMLVLEGDRVELGQPLHAWSTRTRPSVLRGPKRASRQRRPLPRSRRPGSQPPSRTGRNPTSLSVPSPAIRQGLKNSAPASPSSHR
ncbi:MAG: hypothetical protein R3B67_08885 [Phycisphaerales bacterium]